jgi:outer membrane protein assembly factor BamA
MQIKKSWVEIPGIYGKKGYLKIGIRPEPAFDEASRTVTYKVAITEGSQYRMGQVMIAGLTDDEAGRVKGAWGLKTGEVFDTSYFSREFLEKVSRDRLLKQPNGLSVTPDYKRDDQALTVDVVVKFTRKP